MVVARGNFTYIVKLQRGHVDIMQDWEAHTDPLFRSYTFPKMNHAERDYWYHKKTYSLSKKSYAVFNEDHKMVGYLSLRNIKLFRRTSELGIVFDPGNLNQGYGTDCLRAFIPFYFEKLKMSRLDLRVAEFNYRAQQCYLNSGFVMKGLEYNEFEDQGLAVFKDPSLMEYRRYFKMENRRLKCRFIHMYISKEMYMKNKDNYPQYPPNTCA